MEVALVILNWNGQKLLEEFLPSLLNYSREQGVTIYVADNASTDNSVSFVKEHFKEVVVIKNAENEGFAKGYNMALQQVKADVYGLINSDIEVTKDWLPPILSLFEKEEKTAVIQPKILSYKEKDTFEYAGAGGGFIDKLGYPYCRGRIFNSLEKDTSQYDDTTPIFWASGACFFIRSVVFWEMNGFDEDYFAHQEEIDLCWRIQNEGYNILYTGKSTVYHIGGATLQESNPQKTFLNFRNSLFSILKNVPAKKIIPLIFVRLVLDGIAGLKFFMELRPRHTFAIIKAHLSFYNNVSKILKKRKHTAKKEDYYLVKSIVWNYFILRKKTFKELS
ncbi:MAG: glycosyltransferase family 2 protein [Flavobacteriaceae bacterium]|nr:glycosyltransferase family 2 protein [Flavobacteriaceae bacterium]